MDVREAVRIAREYILELYAQEEVSFVGVEEIEYEGNMWYVTIGFFRPWARGDTSLGSVISGTTAFDPEKRTFKRVCINASGQVVAMKNRMLVETD